MSQPQPDREIIRERVEVQPLVSGAEIIDELGALAVYEDIRQTNPNLFKHLGDQISAVEASVDAEVGDRVPQHLLRGVIARAVIAAAAQTVSDIGQGLKDLHAFKQSLGITSEFVPTAKPD